MERFQRIPAPLLGGQVRIDVSALQVNIDHLMAFLFQDLHRLGSDAAGAAGNDIDAHRVCLLLLFFILYYKV